MGSAVTEEARWEALRGLLRGEIPESGVWARLGWIAAGDRRLRAPDYWTRRVLATGVGYLILMFAGRRVVEVVVWQPAHPWQYALAGADIMFWTSFGVWLARHTWQCFTYTDVSALRVSALLLDLPVPDTEMEKAIQRMETVEEHRKITHRIQTWWGIRKNTER